MLQSELSPRTILHTLGIDETTAITPAQGGFDTAIWKVEHGKQVSALRVFRANEYERCKHEQIVMETARAAGLPVPEIQQAGVWQDRPVLLISWLTGHTIEEELRRRPWRVRDMGLAFGRMHARIHRVTAPALLRQQPDDWIGWQCQGEDALQDRLRLAHPEQSALLHLDYHVRNVLTDGKEITAILDWTNALAGDPRADVARTLSILRVDPLVRKPLLKRAALRIFEQAWLSGYQREHGQLQEMALFYAWAGTVIQRDLTPRYKNAPHELAPARRWTEKWKTRGMSAHHDHA